MAVGFIRWMSQGYEAAKENRWLLSLIAAMLLFGSTVGISLLRGEMHRQMNPVVDMIRWDFENRGIWDEYLKHKALAESRDKAFEPSPSASVGYPLFQYRER